MPVDKVSMESAPQVGSQEESLSPEMVCFVFDRDGIEDIIGTCFGIKTNGRKAIARTVVIGE